MSKYQFYAKTGDAYIIKILVEILSSYLQEGCFQITQDQLLLEASDEQQKINFKLALHFDKFKKSKSNIESRFIGIDLKNMYKLLRSIRKKDIITMFITNDDPDRLGLQIENYETDRISTNYIKIKMIQPIIVQNASNYHGQINIPSKEFQRLCKDMNSLTKVIRVFTNGSQITFYTDEDEEYSGNVTFGAFDEIDDEENTLEEYNASFDMKLLQKMVKVTGLSKRISICTKTNEAILFKIDVGTLGELSIYIRSKEQVIQQIQNNYQDYHDDSD